MNGCLLRLRTTLNMCRNILQDHNSIIHHITDSDGQTGHGNHVQGTACDIEVDERCHQGKWNSNGNDDSSTPTAQEDKYDQDDE